MKNFEKPSFEVVRLNEDVIVTSACGCYSEDFGDLGKVCQGDVGYCACKVNYNPAEDNCTECTLHQDN